MLYFVAPYEDREKIMELGAEWEFPKWRWRIDDRKNYAKFSRWLDGSLITEELYILEAPISCPHCGKNTKVTALATGEYYEDFEPTAYGGNEMNILYGFENISGGLAEFLKEKFPLKKRYSAPHGYKYLINGCGHCDGIISDDSLFGEEGSLFFINSTEKANNLKMYKVLADGDIVLNAKVALSFDKKYFENVEITKIDNIKF